MNEIKLITDTQLDHDCVLAEATDRFGNKYIVEWEAELGSILDFDSFAVMTQDHKIVKDCAIVEEFSETCPYCSNGCNYCII